MWRDQFLFLGDDGTVVALVAQRRSPDAVELKLWLSESERWGVEFYQEDRLRAELRDVGKVMTAWSRRPTSPFRLSISEGASPLQLQLRTRQLLVSLSCAELRELARVSDPEGTSIYRAGRATLSRGTTASSEAHGWLVVESTPPGQPKRANVEYGEFSFVVAASPTRLFALKHSADQQGYEFGVVHGESTSHTERVGLRAEEGSLAVSLPDLAVSHTLAVRDQRVSRGETAGGAAREYRVLLLGGDGLVGVAFTIGRGPAAGAR